MQVLTVTLPYPISEPLLGQPRGDAPKAVSPWW